MLFKDIASGTEISLNLYNEIINVIVTRLSSYKSYVLLASKIKYKTFWDRSGNGIDIIDALDEYDCNYGYLVYEDENMDMMILSSDSEIQIKSRVSTGLGCKRCHDFNSFAEPNQPDGSYVCFSCRQGGY